MPRLRTMSFTRFNITHENHKIKRTKNVQVLSVAPSVPSLGSSRFALRPCLLLLWTNMLSDIASRGPSTIT